MKHSYDAIASAITAQIDRVSAKREALLRSAQATNTVGQHRASLYLMDQAIHHGRTSRTDGSTVLMLAALRALKDIPE